MCDCFCINHTFTAFNQISILMPFSSPIYVDYNDIFLVFTRLTDLRFKNYGWPNTSVSKFFFLEKFDFSVRCNYSVPCCVQHAVVITHAANATLDGSGDLQFGVTRDYPKKPSRLVTTHFDKENQVFLTTNCDHLQGPLTSLHSLSVNGSSGIALE